MTGLRTGPISGMTSYPKPQNSITRLPVVADRRLKTQFVALTPFLPKILSSGLLLGVFESKMTLAENCASRVPSGGQLFSPAILGHAMTL